jgi:hypothetical protein
MAYGTRPSLPKRGSTPDELDPVAASSTPITPDPRTRPRINSSAASADPEAIDAVRRRLIAAGIDPETAQAMAMQQVLDTKQGVLDEMDAPRREREAREAAAAVPSAPQEPYVSPDEIRAAGYMPQAEPGPTSVRGGGKVAQGQQFNKMSDAIDYMTRTPVTDANRAQAMPDAAYMPSQRDRDMAARGFFPVYADDGSVSYSVGTGREGMYPQDLDQGRGIPGGLGRVGPRRDLQETNPSLPGFTLDRVRGPTGYNYIYKQNDAAEKQQAAYMDERQIARFADASGLTEAELAAMTPAQRRSAVRGAKRADASDREEAWRAQMMLGGGRPTGGIGGSKATVNAWLNLPEDQRASAMRYMLPGGQLSATVDANNAAQAGRMAQAAMTAFLNGQNSGQLNPLQQQQLTQMQSQLPVAEQVPLHKDKPGVHQSELKYADDYIGTHYSSGGGMLGISSEFTMAEQQSVIDHLVNDMGYAPAKAQKIVDEIARRRNAGSWMGSPVRNAAPGAAPGSAAPPPAPTPGSDPRARGGGA